MEKSSFLRLAVRIYAGGGGARADALLEAMCTERTVREVAHDRGVKRQSLDALVKRCRSTIASSLKAEGLGRGALLAKDHG